jgi:hypothetical protein
MGLSDGESHPALGLMEVSVRALSQANDAARYARHAIDYCAQPKHMKDDLKPGDTLTGSIPQ